jgi:hypothetical protein
MKRIVSLMLILCLLPIAGVPAVAAVQPPDAVFTDVADGETKRAAELLFRLGIVSGTGGGSYSPGRLFDRAALAVIGTRLSGLFDVSTFGGTVRFPDVRTTHWAHRWVNAATSARGTVPPIMVGGTDGLFHPDGPMLYGQLVTVLMKLLGYTDADVGLNWPHSYIARAEALGLSEGMSFDANHPLTRGEAARLIYNFLFIEIKGDEATYIEAAFAVTTVPTFHQGQLSIMLLDRTGNILAIESDHTVTYKPSAVANARSGGMEMTDGSYVPVSGAKVLEWNGGEGNYAAASFQAEEPVTLIYRGNTLLYIVRDSVPVLLRMERIGHTTFVVDERGNNYPLKGSIDAALTGQTGWLRLDLDGNAVGFTSLRSITYQTVTLTADIRASGFAPDGGNFIAVPPKTPVWIEGGAEEYAEVWSDTQIMRPGRTFLLARNTAGNLAYIFPTTQRGAGEYRLSVIETQPAAGSNPLTAAFGAGAAGAALYKNGLPAELSMLERWDVLMYYESAGIVEASSLHISGFHSVPGLNDPQTPAIIMLFGREFTLLPEASAKMSQYNVGLRWLFLLTHDGRVADVRSVEQSSRAPVGLATEKGVLVGTSAYGLSLEAAANGFQIGHVGRFQGTADGRIQLTPFTMQAGGHGELNLAGRTLGSVPLAPWCAFYDRAGLNGRAVRVSPADIPVTRVPANKVLYAEIGPSGYATAVVLDNVTGDSYQYGFVFIEEIKVSAPSGEEEIAEGTPPDEVVDRIEAGVSPTNQRNDVAEWYRVNAVPLPRDGTVVGIAVVNALSGQEGIISDVILCVRHQGLTRFDFNGTQSVRINGADVPVAAGAAAAVFVPSAPAGFRQMSLAEARSYCRTFEVYTDPDGVKARLIIGYP